MLLLLFLISDLHFLIPAAVTQIFNPIAELVIPTGIPTKEAKAVSTQYNSKLYKLLFAYYSLMHFDLFLQLKNFLSHLNFSV